MVGSEFKKLKGAVQEQSVSSTPHFARATQKYGDMEMLY
jgi:hypothetical protein